MELMLYAMDTFCVRYVYGMVVVCGGGGTYCTLPVPTSRSSSRYLVLTYIDNGPGKSGGRTRSHARRDESSKITTYHHNSQDQNSSAHPPPPTRHTLNLKQ